MNALKKYPLVSIIIANYNGLPHLKMLLPTLKAIDYPRTEIIIADNNSRDGSLEYIKKHYPNVILIELKRNTGFTGGNNAGYALAKGEYILFLNNDTRVEKNFINLLVNLIHNKPDIGGVQAKILLMNDSRTLDSVGAFLTPTGFLYHHGALKKDTKRYDKHFFLYAAKGTCMLFKRDVLRKIEVDGEIFDGDYFAYFEETDLCHRVWLAGYKILFEPSSVVYHALGGTSKKMNVSFIQYNSFKNRINSYLKNLSNGNLFRILLPHLIICEIVAIISIARNRGYMFFAINKAFLWNLFYIKKTLKKRSVVQRNIRKVSDQYLFKFILKKLTIRYYIAMFTDKVDSFADIEVQSMN